MSSVYPNYPFWTPDNDHATILNFVHFINKDAECISASGFGETKEGNTHVWVQINGDYPHQLNSSGRTININFVVVGVGECGVAPDMFIENLAPPGTLYSDGHLEYVFMKAVIACIGMHVSFPMNQTQYPFWFSGNPLSSIMHLVKHMTLHPQSITFIDDEHVSVSLRVNQFFPKIIPSEFSAIFISYDSKTPDEIYIKRVTGFTTTRHLDACVKDPMIVFAIRTCVANELKNRQRV